MPITFSNTGYKSGTSSSPTTNFLKTVTGEYGVFATDFQSFPYYEPDRFGSMSIISPDIIRLDDGSTWYDKGFIEGEQLQLNFTLTNSNPTGSTAGVTFHYQYRFNVDYIDENIMYINSIISRVSADKVTYSNWASVSSLSVGDYFKDYQLPSTSQSGNINSEFYGTVIYSTTNNYSGVFPSFEVNYGKTQNGDRNNGTVISIYDQTEPKIVFGQIGFDNELGDYGITASGSGVLKSTLRIKSIDTINVAGYSIQVPRYRFEVLFHLSSFGQKFNFDAETTPDYLFDRESITDGINIKCNRSADDETSSVQGNKTLKKGRVGYLGESYKGIPTNVRAEDVTYYDKNGEEDTSISYNDVSSIEFTLKGVSAASRLNFGLAVVPNGYPTNDKKAYQNYQLVTGRSGYGSFDPSDDNLWDITPNYYQVGDISNSLVQGYGKLDIEHISLQDLGGNNVKVKIRFIPNNRNITLSENDYFVVYATVNGEHACKVDYQNFKEYINILGELDADTVFYPSYLDLDTDNGLRMPDVTTVDDLYAKGYFRVPENENIKSISFKVEAVNGDLEYELQDDTFEINETTLQTQINESKTTNISGMPEDRTEILAQYSPTFFRSVNGIDYNGFRFNYPFRSRWEYWIERLDTPDKWFNGLLPNDGRNNDWIDYLRVSGTTIRMSVYVEVDGGFYVKRFDVSPRDYNTSSDVTTLIEVFRTSDNALLWTSTNSDGYDTGYLLEDTDVYIKATHTKTGGWATNGAGYITIERTEENGQYEIQSTFSEITQPLNSVLGQITKTYDGDDMILQANLIGSFVSSDFDYTIKSRSFNIVDGSTGIGGITTYNPFTSEFTSEFTVEYTSVFS